MLCSPAFDRRAAALALLVLLLLLPGGPAHGQAAAPVPAATEPATDGSAAWCAPPRVLRETARDDFRGDGGHLGGPGGPGGSVEPDSWRGRWRLEAQSADAQVSVAEPGLLDIRTPAGLSLWWHAPLRGDHAIRFQARALPAPDSAGALAGRVSDLNLFWNATEADGQAPRVRDGSFASHDSLRAYYLGYGANGNRSTRVRAYDGQGRRTVLAGWADPPEAGPDDRQGPMTAATRLVPGQWLAVELVSHAPHAPHDPRDPHAGIPVHGHVRVGGQHLLTLAQPQPLLGGWFALRTTASRLQVRGFHILHCTLP